MNREVHSGKETLNKDEHTVSRLVAGLKHVDAPANFESRVMARISEGRPRSRKLFSVPAIAYAVPALVVLLVATFFVFKLRQQAPAQPGPAIVETIGEPQNSPLVITTQTPVPDVAIQRSPEAQHPSGSDTRVALRRRSNANSGQGPGSYIESLPNKKLPRPEGLDNTSPSSANRNDVMTSTPLAIKDVLSNLGMSVKFENGWQVEALTESGVAQKSGIKVGDVITSLDDRAIDSSTAFNGFGSFRSVTVSRDGKLVPLKLVLH